MPNWRRRASARTATPSPSRSSWTTNALAEPGGGVSRFPSSRPGFHSRRGCAACYGTYNKPLPGGPIRGRRRGTPEGPHPAGAHGQAANEVGVSSQKHALAGQAGPRDEGDGVAGVPRRRGCGPGASRALPYALPGGMQTRTQGSTRSVAVGQRMILERRPVHVHAKIVLTPGTWPARSTTRTYGMTHSGPDPLRRKDRRAAEHRPGHERAEQDSA